jgi:hypothetical protein
VTDNVKEERSPSAITDLTKPTKPVRGVDTQIFQGPIRHGSSRRRFRAFLRMRVLLDLGLMINE